MFVRLVVLFTVVPFLELALLIKIGTVIGTIDTILLIIITGVIGAMMVRAAGVQCLFRIQAHMRDGAFPADELVNGFLILVAGALLITPGLLTDTAGFLLLIPQTRDAAKRRIKRYLTSRMNQQSYHVDLS